MPAERTVLVVSGGLEAVPGIERIRALGCRVVVSDGAPDAPGFAAADDRIVASTYDVDATVAAARAFAAERPIDGVTSIAADVPLTTASVAHALDLPGIPLEAARLATDKLGMKERFLADDVPVPWFAPVRSADELAALVRERGFPLVLKPTDSRGARGVLVLAEGVDLGWAYAHARDASPTGRTLVEAFVDGPQLSTESLVLDGEVVTLGFSDRNYDRLDEFAPFVIEDGGCQPSMHLSDALEPVDAVLGAAARSLGIENGTLKGDVVLDPERGPVLIEVAPRLSGGWFCTDQIPRSTGVDLVQAAARLALGETLSPAEVAPTRFDPIAVRYAFPPAGRVRAVLGVEEARALPGVVRVETFVAPGERIEPVTDHTRRAAVALAVGATRAEAVERAREAVRKVRFDLADE